MYTDCPYPPLLSLGHTALLPRPGGSPDSPHFLTGPPWAPVASSACWGGSPVRGQASQPPLDSPLLGEKMLTSHSRSWPSRPPYTHTPLIRHTHALYAGQETHTKQAHTCKGHRARIRRASSLCWQHAHTLPHPPDSPVPYPTRTGVSTSGGSRDPSSPFLAQLRASGASALPLEPSCPCPPRPGRRWHVLTRS